MAAILGSTLEYVRRWRDQGRFEQTLLSELDMFAWRIAFAWEQVVAGDIEDLAENLAWEEAARFLDRRTLSGLKQYSLSDQELVLPVGQAVAALEALAADRVPVLGWEGWIRYPDGRVGHSRQHQGTVSIDRLPDEALTKYVERSVTFAQQTIIAAQAEWDRKPEVPGGQLYFCITMADIRQAHRGVADLLD